MDRKLTIKKISEWRIPLKGMFLIAGPCSAESEEQVVKTAQAIAQYDVTALRAGVWKPRTRPGAFEGAGIEGLKWLKAGGAAAGLPVTTEVATPAHIEKCLKYGVDILWIGARTTVDPFAVQAIADALRGVDVPVMVKNPINADIELWIGAFERLNRAGVTKLMAVHRGFSTHETKIYRYEPLWKIPTELRMCLPGIPIICDPSHICGNMEHLYDVAQDALNLLYDGLMIEVHIEPHKALSDSKQQLTPAEFGRCLNRLNLRKHSTDNPDYLSKMSFFRKEIDHIDYQLIDLLGQRMEIAKEIGLCKKRDNVALFQPDRWSEVIRSRIEMGIKNKLSEDFILQIYESIHEESIKNQI